MPDVNANVNVNLKVRDQGLLAAVDQLGDGMADLAAVEVDVRTKAELAAAAFDTIDVAALRAATASAEFTAALGKMGDRLVGLVPLEDGAARSTTEFERSLRRLDHVLQEVDDEELVFARTTKTQVTPALDQAAAGVEKVTKSKRNMAQAALQGSRALQDFVQGGIGGILNNVEGVAAALGAGAGVAGLMTAIGVAAFIALPFVKSLWASIAGGAANDVPKARDQVGRLNDELKTLKDRLEELEGKGRLTPAELAELLDGRGKLLALEEKIATAKERQAAIDAQRKKERDGDKDSGAAVGEVMKGLGGVDKVAADYAAARPGAASAAKAQLDQVLAARAAAMAGAGANFQRRSGVDKRFEADVAKARAAYESASAAAERQASDVVGRALLGDQAAVRDLDRTLPGRDFGMATSEGVANRKAAEKSLKEKLGGVGEWAKKARKDFDAGNKEAAAVEAFDQKQRLDVQDRLARFELEKQAARKKKNADVAATVEDSMDAAHELGVDMAKGGAKDTPTARLQARRQKTLDAVAGEAERLDDGEFNPADMDRIVREAASTTSGLDTTSVQQALFRAAAAVRAQNQRDLDRAMGRMWQGGDSFLDN